MSADTSTYIPNPLKELGKYKYQDISDSIPEEQANFVREKLSAEGVQVLTRGIVEYELTYSESVQNFSQSSTFRAASRAEINNKNYFRTLFIEYITSINNSKNKEYKGDPKLRATDPEKATTTIEAFLDKKGLDLYKKALEEEYQSEAYRNAVFKASFTHLDGQKWAKRFVGIIAGPSGCGKSSATKLALERAEMLMPKLLDNDEGNDILTIDGGIAREVSQMRKLLIIAVKNKGYAGLIDMDDHVINISSKIKKLFSEIALNHSNLNLLIPETCSGFTVWVKSECRKFFENINKLNDTLTFFCRIDGDSSFFRYVVECLGNLRAWFTSPDDEQIPLSLNNPDVPEFKKYNSLGFFFGLIGSLRAERWFANQNKENIALRITNDLRLKKQVGSEWVDVTEKEDGVVLISERLYQQWLKASKGQDVKEIIPLSEYAKQRLNPIIETSAGLDLADAKLKLIKIIESLSAQMAKHENKKSSFLKAKLECLSFFITCLNSINLETMTLREANDLIANCKAQLHKMERDGLFSLFSTTRDSLRSIIKALSKWRDDHQIFTQINESKVELKINSDSKVDAQLTEEDKVLINKFNRLTRRYTLNFQEHKKLQKERPIYVPFHLTR